MGACCAKGLGNENVDTKEEKFFAADSKKEISEEEDGVTLERVGKTITREEARFLKLVSTMSSHKAQTNVRLPLSSQEIYNKLGPYSFDFVFPDKLKRVFKDPTELESGGQYCGYWYSNPGWIS